ncbi:TonB-dependent receptor [Steroidobacter cummioxidans]|uniref:TonB-dependent receptor n=1 Tax=Steroidobacter cummioxidans TaxID=1803913 RepID=UPI0019D494F7|nr:TonB-dependent receptor [Steroidobacter cummioxidans]
MCALIATTGTPVLAEDVNVESDSGGRAVEEIIVTAQKREQNLQDVPIVITALSAGLLRDAGVRDLRDLAVLAPGLQVISTSSEATSTARLRNIGTAGENPGLESSVGMEIDGVYRPRTGIGLGDLGELERVEVLKGPQGTLFGKNNSAGVIRVMTKRPEFTFGGQAEATFGNYGAAYGAVSATGPLIADQLAGRIYLVGAERDGFYDVRVGEGPRTAREDQTQNLRGVRGQLLFTPTDNLDIRMIADFSERDEFCCVAVQQTTGPAAGLIDALATDEGVMRPAAPFERVAYANRNTQQEIEDKGVSVELNWTTPWLGQAALTSITAVRDWQVINGEDSDFTSADIWYREADDRNGYRFRQLTQELRLAGTAGRIDWLVGGFYAGEDLDRNATQYYGPDYEPYLGLLLSNGARADFVSILTGRPFGTNFSGLNTESHYRQTSRSTALFTNQTLHATDRLSLSLGLRYTQEEKKLDTYYFNGSSPACQAALGRTAIIAGIVGAANVPEVLGTICLPWADASFDGMVTQQKRSEDEWSGEIKASYRFADSLMVYGGYARGYKAGGFNLDRSRIAIGVPDPDTSFGAEIVDSYEVGAKATLMDEQLLLNAALFDEQFTGYQYNLFTGIGFIVTGIPDVRSRGAEMDFLWRSPVGGLSLQGGVTYAEAKYGNFTPPQGLSNAIVGSQLPNAPHWSGSLAATYRHPIGGGLELRTNVSARYNSRHAMSATDLTRVQDELTVINARIGVGPESERWAVELWAQNLTDAEYYQSMFDGPLQPGTTAAFLGAPRTWGATLRIAF